MRGAPRLSTLAESAVYLVAVLVLGYLAAMAHSDRIRQYVPVWFAWFGRPSSFPAVAVAVAVSGAAYYVLYRRARGGRAGAPVVLVVVLSATSLLLAMASYWPCTWRTKFFTQLIFGAGVVKGGIADIPGRGGPSCPTPVPVALDLARLMALSALFIGAVGIAAAVFRSHMDRVRVFFAKRVAVVVGVDEDAMTLVEVIGDVLQPGTTLVLITDNPDGSSERRARLLGARVITADLKHPKAVNVHRLVPWRRLKHLFLLSPDPWTNLLLLKVIGDRLTSIDPKRRNILTLVRIDDPWQAEAFRAQHFSDPDSPWIAVVGIYEVTARRLLDRILASGSVARLVIAGASPLTLALLGDLVRRQAKLNTRWSKSQGLFCRPWSPRPRTKFARTMSGISRTSDCRPASRRSSTR